MFDYPTDFALYGKTLKCTFFFKYYSLIFTKRKSTEQSNFREALRKRRLKYLSSFFISEIQELDVLIVSACSMLIARKRVISVLDGI